MKHNYSEYMINAYTHFSPCLIILPTKITGQPASNTELRREG